MQFNLCLLYGQLTLWLTQWRWNGCIHNVITWLWMDSIDCKLWKVWSRRNHWNCPIDCRVISPHHFVSLHSTLQELCCQKLIRMLCVPFAGHVSPKRIMFLLEFAEMSLTCPFGVCGLHVRCCLNKFIVVQKFEKHFFGTSFAQWLWRPCENVPVQLGGCQQNTVIQSVE